MINAEQYIPLVHKIARGIHKKFSFKYEYEELFQVGCLGLMKAVKSFDESKGAKFITYAYMGIRTSILNFMRSDSWYIATRCKDRIKKSYPPDSLDICLIDEGDTLKNRIPYIEDDYSSVDLGIILHSLPIELRKVLVLRFIKGLKIKEVEQVLGVSHGTVVKRQKEGLKILREELEA
ncbi:sigma-70 family RNA polymerase sigma factor [Clostridium kluyveri]|uniref:sigma-70 family RNA polymerase sigma factor n=1 Tax=Clostridium kluyveri TaxID=1534 RepID=UPI0022453926|nr:sigma-70 family RNA polymerase sigma factor [Clostridium kluyveri]UZQ49085.1 sigma-70 family RNA polymerase sigma factor [Clostridium kluyveri]